MQLVHLPRSSIVYGTIKNRKIFEKLRALSFYASFNEFIYMVPLLVTSSFAVRINGVRLYEIVASLVQDWLCTPHETLFTDFTCQTSLVGARKGFYTM